MVPDLELLAELVATSPAVHTWPGRGRSSVAISDAEAVIGPLPASFRWWLATHGQGRIDGASVLTTVPPPPPEPADEPDPAAAPDDLTRARTGDRLAFLPASDCGDSYSFALDQWTGRECPVIRRDHLTGEEERVADSFAGFLAVRTALALGLREGPNPTVARLWRATPGVLRPDGRHLYGPHTIQERNATFEVPRYAPHWVLVGDDSGGGGYLMRRHGRDRTAVHRVDLGALGADPGTEGEWLTDDLLGWVGAR
ncbi:hypothetical protein RM844_21915 [Streptomyces sp. DSM 44915]|uniref:SMI1/KNR4 family protein n=1 Tax=Streptomyces chisholmiae TaxID=3075540 RepID=A0ABU2JVD5_9ACTN|nr:hypothetical protein [Streptomyces sp. DSM 44915]MDT0268945.1 hypothetical protein [Streptomyces sp. DSM 44915]